MDPNAASNGSATTAKKAVIKRPSMAEEPMDSAVMREEAADQVAKKKRTRVTKRPQAASSSAESVPHMEENTEVTEAVQTEDSEDTPTMKVELICWGKNNGRPSGFLYFDGNDWSLRTFNAPEAVMEAIPEFSMDDAMAVVIEATVHADPITGRYMEDPRDFSGYINSFDIKGQMRGFLVRQQLLGDGAETQSSQILS